MTIITLHDKCVDRLLEQRRERRETQRRQERDAALVRQAFIDTELAGVTLWQETVSVFFEGQSCYIVVDFPCDARVMSTHGFTACEGDVEPPFARACWVAERGDDDQHNFDTFIDAVIYARDIKLEEES